MLKIIYRNEYGEIQIGGSLLSGLPLNATAIEGLKPPGAEFQTKVFANHPGLLTIAKRDIQRTITISGAFHGDSRDVQKMYSVLYRPGTLFFDFPTGKKKIQARYMESDGFKKEGKGDLYTFVLQFQADYPYFADAEQNVAYVFKRMDLISQVFELPCVFTERTTVADIEIKGEKDIYPVIYISNGLDEAAMLSEDAGILIENQTTGAKIDFAYTPEVGEIVTIDLPNRKITNNKGENLTNFISDDTVLSDFVLKPGENRVNAYNRNAGCAISVSVAYYNEYVSAVY